MARTLLIIDDDTFFCKSLLTYFNNYSFDAFAVHTGGDALDWCRHNQADVVLLDQKLPDTLGSKLCKKLLEHSELSKIIFITAFPSFTHAVEAIRNGAYDYLSKPLELAELKIATEKAFKAVEFERAESLHKFKELKEYQDNLLIGLDSGLKPIKHLIEQAAISSAPVLITGETGTGKNIVAKTIHYFGEKDNPPFVEVNCAALPENLIESELFGHEKGAFTGADTVKNGLFEMADGGTIFLDEIGELPMHLQTKLLGVLDEGTVRRIGSNVSRKVDIRIIAATNINMEQAISEKKFREDLYYRLGVLVLHISPLRERLDDIEPLCHQFIKVLQPDKKLILPQAEIDSLREHSWPGNIRELRNTIERACILRKDHILLPSTLLTGARVQKETSHVNGTSVCNDRPIATLEEVERQHIHQVLVSLDNNQTKAAKHLGIARSTLVRKLSQYNMS